MALYRVTMVVCDMARPETFPGVAIRRFGEVMFTFVDLF